MFGKCDMKAENQNSRKLKSYAYVVLLCFIGIVCMRQKSVEAAGIYTEPASTRMSHNWAYPVKCHTIAGENGDTMLFYSVQGEDAEQTIMIDKVSRDGTRENYKELSVPGETWGGTVYQAPDGCNYIATGNDGEIAYYVMKYDAYWNLLGTVSVTKEQSYTQTAFDAGNSDMTMAGDYLIVHAARKRPDGHQSNTTIWINSKTMRPVYVPKEYGDTHVSHSFSQFVRYDGNRVIMIDQGDAYPRGICMTSQKPDLMGKDTKTLSLMKFWLAGSVGETTDMSVLNYTGTTVDGFELGENHHLVVGTSIPHDEFTSGQEYEGYEGSNNVYAVLVDKDLNASRLKWLTSYPTDIRVKNLELVKVNDDRFIIVYGTEKESVEGEDATHYMLIDSDGDILQSGEIPKSFYCTSEPSFDGEVLTWCHYVESELGHFMAMSRWDIVTGDFSVRNIDTGMPSGISSLFPLKDVRNEYQTGEIVELELGVFSALFEEKYDLAAAVVWESSDSDVIEVLNEESVLSRSVSSSSKYIQWYKRTSSSFRAKGKGTATLTCKVGDKRWSAIFTVSPETTPTPYPVVVPSSAPTMRPTVTPVILPTECPTIMPASSSGPTAGPVGDTESGNSIPKEYGNQLRNYIPDTYGECRTSFLGKYIDGGYQAVIYYKGKIYVQNMSSTYEIKSTKEIELELPLWGGVYLGETNNYIVCGDTYKSGIEGGGEVYRIIKYDKEFRRLGSVSLTGDETYTSVPFDDGNVSIDEGGNLLTVYTSRLRLDGHQSNIAIHINTSDMMISNRDGILPFPDVHTSHSFRQICKYDEKEPVYVDVTDGEPERSVYIQFGVAEASLIDIDGQHGENRTYTELSGLGISNTDYLVVGSYKGNIYLSCINKRSEKVRNQWLTSSSGFLPQFASNPRITKIQNNRFVVMWSGGNVLYYILVDGEGNIVSERKEITASVTDCEPLYDNGRILWLSVGNGDMAVHEIMDFSENGVYNLQEQELAQSEHAWDGTADISWYDENKTEFSISTAEQLAGLAQLVNEGNTFEDKKISLQEDIFLNEVPYQYPNEWIPIARYDDNIYNTNAFQGTFNGNKHKIYNMRTGDKFDGGLFGYIGKKGVVKCVDISQGYLYSGGCITNVNEGIISFCNNVSVTGGIKKNGNVGGVGGICNINNNLVYGCKNFSEVWGGSIDSAGGIVGLNRGTVSACSNHGLVSGDAAGIVYANYGCIYNCYCKGIISNRTIGAGFKGAREINGIAAYNTHILENCYFAGILAYTYTSQDMWMGAYAICREDHDKKVANCYTIPSDGIVGHGVSEVSPDEMKSPDFIQKLDQQTNSVFSVWREDKDNTNDGFPITVADVSYNTGQCKIQPEAWILHGKKEIEVNLSKKQYDFSSFSYFYNDADPILTIENTDIAEVSEGQVVLLKKAGTTAIHIHFDETENNSSADYQLMLTINDDTPKRDIRECSITLSQSYTFYTGEEIELQVTVKDGEKVLEEGVDYELTYKNNVEVGGRATVIITGKGNYTETAMKYFTIAPVKTNTPEPSEMPGTSQPSSQATQSSGPVSTVSPTVNKVEKNKKDDYDEEDDDDDDGKIELKKGDYFMSGNIVYKVTKRKGKKGEVAVAGVKSKKSRSIVIPNKVKKQGITFIVTSIQKNAFKGCKKAKVMNIKSTGLKTITKSALNGLDKKLRIKIPKSKATQYRKMLKKCGYGKNVK